MKYFLLIVTIFMVTNELSAQNDQSDLMVTTSILPKTHTKSNEKLFFTIQLGASKKEDALLANLDNIVIYKKGGINIYRIGEFTSYDMAKEFKKMLKKSCKGAFIVAVKNGKRIHIKEALQ